MSGSETFIIIIVIVAVYSLVDNHLARKHK